MTTESGYDDKAYDARMEELYDLPLSFSLLVLRWRPMFNSVWCMAMQLQRGGRVLFRMD